MDAFEDQVVQAIADSLSEIDGLQESPYMLANSTPPSAEVIPGLIEFDETFSRGMDKYAATIRVTVGTALTKASQKRLLSFRAPYGPTSIKEAVERDRTLGGLTADLNVNRVSPIRNFRRPDGETVIGCDFEIEYEGSGDGH